MNYISFIKGFIIGASILIPGLSGGTTAIILNVYTELIDFVSNPFKKNKKQIIAVAILISGCLTGIFSVTKPIEWLLEKYTIQFSFISAGLITGSLPLFVKGFKRNYFKNTILILSGLLFTVLADSLIDIKSGNGFIIIMSVLMAVALILPGISITNVLIAFGYYEKLIAAINEPDIAFLSTLGVLLIISIVVLSKILNNLFKKHPISVNMLILGMVLGSLKEVYAGLPHRGEWTGCIALFLLSLLVSLLFISFEKSTDFI